VSITRKASIVPGVLLAVTTSTAIADAQLAHGVCEENTWSELCHHSPERWANNAFWYDLDKQMGGPIGRTVRRIVIDHLGVDEKLVTDDARFIEDLGTDSLDTVELVFAFAEALAIEMPDDAAEECFTVQNAIEFYSRQTHEDNLKRQVLGIKPGKVRWSKVESTPVLDLCGDNDCDEMEQ